jgi:hypothetical protein
MTNINHEQDPQAEVAGHNEYLLPEERARALFDELAGTYEFITETGRATTRPVLEALITYCESFTYRNIAGGMRETYEEALEDARTGRGIAEIENSIRDWRQARQQAVMNEEGK